MTLLQERDATRRQRRLDIRMETRRRLREALSELIPGRRVIVFGSLTKPSIFNDCSDVDLALESELPEMDSLRLMSELSERLERAVDLVLLNKCRLREKILREGETWTV